MIEYPEAVTIARQMREQLYDKPIISVAIADDHPKFMFLNDDLSAYQARLPERNIVDVAAKGKWIFAQLDSGDFLLLGEMFGKILLVSPDTSLPKKAHAVVTFESGETLVVTIQAWGGFQVLTPDELGNHLYTGRQGISILSDDFTPSRFSEILDGSAEWSRKPIKSFLVHEGNVAGIGNGMLQDILLRAQLSPRRKVPEINPEERIRLHGAIVETMTLAIAADGRDTEKDLFGFQGGYIPLMDRRTAGTPCTECGTTIKKISYLGGSCYICPSCQT
jgi:formamidopyrimidine-DNA glycosylase